MYSGGVDSTLAVAQLLESDEVSKMHLLTYCNGLCVRVKNSGVHVAELRKRYGADRVYHEISYVTDIFEELRSPIMELIKEYGSTLIFDLCCRLSFETASVIYCVNHGVKAIACGTNIDQGKLFLEKPEYLKVVTDYFAEYGIDYFTPVYGRMGGRDGRIDRLRERNLSTGPKFFEKISVTSSLFHQPFCLFGIHTFFFTSFAREIPGIKQLSTRFNLSTDDAIRCRLDRQEIARRLIAERTVVATDDDQDGIQIQERFCTTRLCGQKAVEVSLPRNTIIDVDKLGSIWAADGKVEVDGGFLEARRDKLRFEVFSEGRVIVTGTKNRDTAVAAYETHVAAYDVFSVGDEASK